MILITITIFLTMYVCLCCAVTDRQIRDAVSGGAVSLSDVQSVFPVGMCCGRCEDVARNVVDESLRELTCSRGS
jgi:bacterioferritin-associated ferredoxin